MDLPPDIVAALQRFIAFDGYENEIEVLRAALDALQRENDLAAIKEGVADLEAGRYRPWEEVKAELDDKFGFGKS